MAFKWPLMKSDLFKSWSILFVLQALVSLFVFSDFLSGRYFFAYIDIGSDSYFQVVPYTMHLARAIARHSFEGWSFQLGLGGPTPAMFGDMTSMLVQSVGSDQVLQSRILFYILKIVLGGSFFLFFVRHFVKRWESAVICSLGYSFCGYMVIDGQWDVQATAFVFYPLVLWSLVSYLRSGKTFTIPVAIATSLWFGTFFVSLGVFLFFVFVFVIFVGSSERKSIAARQWIFRILPLVTIGYLLAAPYLVPVIFQLSDSSRVSGSESHIHNLLSQSFRVNDLRLILAEIGGLMHKDIFGIGSAYRGHFNYLEGPGFFIGVLLFLLIPQAWNGSTIDRKLVILSATGVTLYIVFPVFRYAAMGFAAPYFRISTLWVSIVLLTLSARAFDVVITRGVDTRLLVFGLSVYGALLSLVLWGQLGGVVWGQHVTKLCWLVLLSTVVLLSARGNLLRERTIPLSLMAVVIIEIVTIARPSFVEGRAMVSSKLHGYDDGTPAALRAIRNSDVSVYRIEKNFDSVSLSDALAQDYMGVKSYSIHSRGLVDFYFGTGLIALTSPILNFTNWLPNAGDRYMLNSLLGVKYFISNSSITWPGFLEIDRAADMHIYRNDLALPLGIVQTQQVTKKALSKLSALPSMDANMFRDIAMINSVVVDDVIPGHGSEFDMEKLLLSKNLSIRDLYVIPAQMLQNEGLQIKHFSDTHIVGFITPSRSGVLVFSIPFNSGWHLKIDGIETDMFRANFGMLAAPVVNGRHSIELDFKTSGQQLGSLLGILGIVMFALASLLESRLCQPSAPKD